MKKNILIAAFIALAAVLSAADKPAAGKQAADRQAQPATPQSQPKAVSGGAPARMGFIFSFENIISDILAYGDGYQSGVGVKYWLKDNLALRGLASLRFNAPTDAASTAPTTTAIGLGAAAECHFKPEAKASPYVGGSLGTRMAFTTGAPAAVDFSLGGMAGVEVKLTDAISLYAEYQLLATVDSKGFTIALANVNNPQKGVVFGFLFYF